jgi:hypothetical protein
MIYGTQLCWAAKHKNSNHEMNFNYNKFWYVNDVLHREVPPGECGSIRNDLPAIEWNNGTKEWYKNGKCTKTREWHKL